MIVPSMKGSKNENPGFKALKERPND